MSFAHFTESGFDAVCDSGIANMQKFCPCGCPPFEDRRIVYVDKHATGTGDGSSWENAYTDIQIAVNAHPKAEIQIKGYGEDDCYPVTISSYQYGEAIGIVLPECTYLHGMDTGNGAVWLDGEDQVRWGIIGNLENVRLDSICLKNCNYYGFYNIAYLNDCIAEDINGNCFYGAVEVKNCIARCVNKSPASTGFWVMNGIINGCIAENTYGGFSVSGTISECVARNLTSNGFILAYYTQYCDTVITDCLADGCGGAGFMYRDYFQVDIIECTAKNCGGGFSKAYYGTGKVITLTGCEAFNSQYCGFGSNQTSAPIYIDCVEYNNCLSGSNSCTPGYPYYGCDEV